MEWVCGPKSKIGKATRESGSAKVWMKASRIARTQVRRIFPQLGILSSKLRDITKWQIVIEHNRRAAKTLG